MSEESAPVVQEERVRLVRGGHVLHQWHCTPADLAALAIGHLYADGFVVDHARVAVQGLSVQLSCDPVPPAPRARGGCAIPDAERFNDLFRALFAGVDARHESGGMHATALADESGIVVQAEDVGRHNSVDKAIGMALLGGADPSALGMLVSARVSGEIARKAAASGVAWLASRSIPTTMAVRIAREAGMPIIGRAAGKNSFVYR